MIIEEVGTALTIVLLAIIALFIQKGERR